MRTQVLIKGALALSVTVASLSSAFAAPQRFYAVSNQTATSPEEERDAFLLASTDIRSEGFESAQVGIPRGTGLSIFNGDGTLTQGRFDTGAVVQGPPALGRRNTTPGPCNLTSTCKWWETPYTFDIKLKSLKSAFGFFATDLGDLGGGLTIDFWKDADKVRSGIAVTQPSTTGGLVFFGWIDDAFMFNRITVNVTQSNTDPTFFDGIGFDDILAGARAVTGPAPVSAPAPLALVALGLGLLGAVRMRSGSAATGH